MLLGIIKRVLPTLSHKSKAAVCEGDEAKTLLQEFLSRMKGKNIFAYFNYVGLKLRYTSAYIGYDFSFLSGSLRPIIITKIFFVKYGLWVTLFLV